MDIAQIAVENHDRWKQEIDDFQDSQIKSLSIENSAYKLDKKIVGAMLNELYYVIDGGTTWVIKESSLSDSPSPRLGSGEHFAILEGFDDGYYFYNTEDLLPHAIVPFIKFWPKLAKLMINDYFQSIDITIDQKRMIYRNNITKPILNKGKIPHDVGSPAADPWNLINAYNFILDSNKWKDHNPIFIIIYALYRRFSGDQISDETWEKLKEAGKQILQDIDNKTGLPCHNEFGDNTWDGFEMSGIGAYSGSLTIAALALLCNIAEELNDLESQTVYTKHLKKARKSYQALWNGKFFATDSSRTHNQSIMADSMLGFFLAHIAGAKDVMPREQINNHMKSVYEMNFKSCHEGKFGPLLVYNPVNSQDHKLQTGEVIVGAAWAAAALACHYGLPEKGDEMAKSIYDIIYIKSGLQFRTPAAWNSNNYYRAALNLRPLAIWLMDPNL